MTETGRAQARPYHHGNLYHDLIDVGRRILEVEGAAALSLRAAARAAGVSPAAPYHHFKDKYELLAAVARSGWKALSGAIVAARHDAASPSAALGEIGLVYVNFARANPALYRLMYDTSRDRTAMFEGNDAGEDAYHHVRCWCAAHGLAEMVNFKDFLPLKAAVGGDQAFMREVLRRVGAFFGAGARDSW